MSTRSRTSRSVARFARFGLVARFALFALIASSCAQPEVNCTSAYGSFAAEYTLTSGDPTTPCAQLPGDVLGMRTYFQPGGPHGTPNYQVAHVAIRPRSLGAQIAYAEARGAVEMDAEFYAANAIGAFTHGFPDDDGFCAADGFEIAAVSLPEIDPIVDDPATPDVDETQPGQPAIDVRYRWRDARFVVSADAQGTQFEADLELEQDGCVAEYHVVGLYPVVACTSDDACEDVHNGINPDFAVRCNLDLGLCVLDGELPAYEGGR